MEDTYEGHDLARTLQAKHGTDRFPHIVAQALKLAVDTGRLADAVLAHSVQRCPAFGELGSHHPMACTELRKAYADAGFSLFEIGNKTGLILETEMARAMALHGEL
jgi:hypothetical protein